MKTYLLLKRLARLEAKSLAELPTVEWVVVDMREELGRRGLPASVLEGADGNRPTYDAALWPPERRRELAADPVERGLPTGWPDA